MRINNTQNINFQKKLIALGAIKQGDISKGVKFFHLDKISDMSDLQRAQKSVNWHGNYYLNDIVDGNGYHISRFDVYTMEDEAQNILGYSVINQKGSQTLLDIIETAPKFSTYRESRPLRYIGETMMAFIATISGKKDIGVNDIAQRPKTKNFYFSQCRFSKNKLDDGATLKKTNFKKLIKSNEAHTGKKVELV